METAFIFPGQGSQYVGMGQDLAAEYPEAAAVFHEADSALGFALSQLCFQGPETVLTDTINAQPALLTHSVAVLKVLAVRGVSAPTSVAGHSMGEYSALVAAGSISFADALKLVQARGRVMKAAGEQCPGMMAAVLGLPDDQVDAVARETGAQIANYNAPGQIVLSGLKDEMERAIALAKSRGARRVIPLAVSIASHSQCMSSAVDEFSSVVSGVRLRSSAVPVISNVTALPLIGADAIRHELVAQLTSSVQWVKSIEYMIAHGVTRFIEVGPKDVLAGLVRRIDKSVHAVSVGDVASIKAFLESTIQGA